VTLHHGWVTAGVTMATTIVPAIGIKVTAVGLLVISVSSTTAQNANAVTHQRRRLAVQALVNVVPSRISATNDAMTRTITAGATGTVEIVAEILVTRGNSIIARPANVGTHQRQFQRKNVAQTPARSLSGKVTATATMEITISVATGTVVTAAGKAATSTSFLTAPSVCAKIPRNPKSVQRTANVVSHST